MENSEQEQCRKSINIKFFRKWRIKRRDGMPKLRVKYFLDFFQWDFLRDEKEQNSLRNGYMYTFLWFVFEKKKCYNTRCATRSSSTKFLSSILAFLRGITFRPQSEMDFKRIIKNIKPKKFVKLKWMSTNFDFTFRGFFLLNCFALFLYTWDFL